MLTETAAKIAHEVNRAYCASQGDTSQIAWEQAPLEGYEKYEVVYAKDQPPYLPLPTLPIGDCLVTRWKLTWRERLAVLFGRDFFLWITTCNQPLQPLLPSFERRGGLKPDYFSEGV